MLGLIAGTTLLSGLSTLPIVDRDEPRFAHATVEMMERGEWIVPYFNDVYRFDKPPLTYWWMRIHYLLLGQNEFSARLHSVLAAFACAAVLFAWGGRLFDRPVGWWAAAGWLTCLQVLIHGRIALADMPMILGVMMMQWGLWETLVERQRGARWWWLTWGGATLGFLAKGPIALLVPLVSWILFALLGRAGHRWEFRSRDWAWGAAFCLAAIAAWGLPANLLTDWAYWKVGIGTHIVERGMAEFNNRAWNPLFYLVIFIFLFPFSGWLPIAVRKAWAAPRRGRFLLLWLLAPILIFTFYQTQLPHYILPGYGGALLMIFGFLNQRDFENSVFAKFLGGIFWFVGLVVFGLLVYAKPPEELESLRWALASVALLCWALALLQLGLIKAKRTIMIIGLILVSVGFSALGRSLRASTVSVEIGRVLGASEAKTYWGIGYGEPSLIYYTHHFWDFPSKEEWASQAGQLESSPADVIIVKRREWRDKRLLDLFTKGDWEVANLTGEAELLPDVMPVNWRKQTLRGLNLARFSWVELELWERVD